MANWEQGALAAMASSARWVKRIEVPLENDPADNLFASTPKTVTGVVHQSVMPNSYCIGRGKKNSYRPRSSEPQTRGGAIANPATPSLRREWQTAGRSRAAKCGHILDAGDLLPFADICNPKAPYRRVARQTGCVGVQLARRGLCDLGIAEVGQQLGIR